MKLRWNSGCIFEQTLFSPASTQGSQPTSGSAAPRYTFQYIRDSFDLPITRLTRATKCRRLEQRGHKTLSRANTGANTWICSNIGKARPRLLVEMLICVVFQPRSANWPLRRRSDTSSWNNHWREGASKLPTSRDQPFSNETKAVIRTHRKLPQT